MGSSQGLRKFHPEEPRAPSQGDGRAGKVNLLPFIHSTVGWVHHFHVYTSCLTKEYLLTTNANRAFFLIYFFVDIPFVFEYKNNIQLFKKNHMT